MYIIKRLASFYRINEIIAEMLAPYNHFKRPLSEQTP